MIKRAELIEAIRNRQINLSNLAFEPTQDCRLRCRHCYMGGARKAELKPEAVDVTLDYFKNRNIAVLNLMGEAALNRTGVQYIDDALRRFGIGFDELDIVTNGIDFDDEFCRILQSIGAKSWRSGAGVSVLLSNDIHHDKAYEDANIDKAQIHENFNLLKERYRDTIICKIQRYTDYEYLRNVGNALQIKNQKFIDPDGLDLAFKGNMLKRLFVDALGNVRPVVMESARAERENWGNVLTKPLEDILIDNGREI